MYNLLLLFSAVGRKKVLIMDAICIFLNYAHKRHMPIRDSEDPKLVNLMLMEMLVRKYVSSSLACVAQS